MKYLLIFLGAMLCLMSCSPTQKKNTEEENSKRNVTLSFNNITIGADTASIDSSCFENELNELFDYNCDPEGAMKNLLTETEQEYKCFNTTLAINNKTKVPLFVNVYEEGGKISKILCVVSGNEYYSDILSLYEQKYGEPSSSGDIEQDSQAFRLCSYKWEFMNNLGIFIQSLDFTGSYFDYGDLAITAQKFECVVIAYCDMNPIEKQKKLEQQRVYEKKTKAAKQKAQVLQQLNNQDI